MRNLMGRTFMVDQSTLRFAAIHRNSSNSSTEKTIAKREKRETPYRRDNFL
jgi:hypothetical protein